MADDQFKFRLKVTDWNGHKSANDFASRPGVMGEFHATVGNLMGRMRTFSNPAFIEVEAKERKGTRWRRIAFFRMATGVQ
jgi:hypothetical protein